MAKDYSLDETSLLSLFDSAAPEDMLYHLGVADDPSVLPEEDEADQAAAATDDAPALDDGDSALDEGGGQETVISVAGIDLSYIGSPGAGAAGGVAAAGAGAATIQAEYVTDSWTGGNGGAGCACPMCGGDSFGQGGVSGSGVGVPAPATTLDTLATYLNERNTGSGGNDFWDDFWGGGSDVATPFWNLTNSGTNARNGTITFTMGNNWFDSNGLADAGRQAAIRNALDVYGDVLGITFVEVNDANANLVFGDWDSGRAYANFDRSSDGSIQRAWINIATNWSGNGTIGDYYFHTALHEIGHTLGLGHQGLYNAGSGSPTYSNSAQWQNDTIQYTMMSYWAQGNYTQPGYNTPSGSFLGDVNIIGPQIVDWIALNRLYAGQGYGIANGQTTGNTTWGFNTTWGVSNASPVINTLNNAFRSMSDLLDTNTICIVDGGGIDTLDLSGFSNNTLIDLRENSGGSTTVYFMNVAGRNGNLSTAVGTVIENAVGGDGSEAMHGNGYDNSLTGNGGQDTIYGHNGADQLYGGLGNDVLYGGGNTDDYLDGGEGADVLYGGLNRQTLVGGNGEDTIYGDSAVPSSVVGDNILAGAGNDFVLGANGYDTIYGGSGADSLRGSDGSDTIYGDTGADTLRGDDGDDLLVPSGSISQGEVYDGGAGLDTLDYSALTSNYTVDLSTGVFSVFNVFIGLITASVAAIETVLAGSGNDTITGDGGANSLYGGTGNDRINDGAGADFVDAGDGDDMIVAGDSSFSGDTFEGGIGNDTISYENFNWGVPPSPVEMNLTTGLASYNGFTESLIGIENVIGSQGNDVIVGNSGANMLDGRNGGDSISGGDGNDTIDGGGGNDVVDDGTGSDFVQAGDGDDMIVAGDSSFLGDTFDGGIGNDTISYAAYSWGAPVSPVEMNLATGLASYNGFTESLIGIENIIGSQGREIIVGDGGANLLDGQGENDRIDGGAGNDTIYGGEGNDSVSGGAGADVLDGGAGNDTLSYAASGAGVTVRLDSSANAGGDAAGDTVTGFEYLIGSNFADVLDAADMSGATIEGGAGKDTITGGFNAQTLYGGAGKDVIYGGESATPTSIVGDTIYAGEGNDRVVGANGADSVWGGGGQDNIQGNAGNDYLDGEGGSDLLNGGAGQDSLYGSGGTDTLNGGDDNDQLYGGDDGDAVRGDGGDDLAYGGVGGDDMSGGIGLDTLYGENGNDTMRGDGGDDWLYGGNDFDTLAGGSGNDTLYGGNANDWLSGDNDSDFLFGEVGNDTLNGGAGADFLYGGGGTDSLTGGGGVDTFVWTSAGDVGNGVGRDVVTDFQAGVDKLNFAAIQAGMTFIGVDVAFSGAAGEIRYMSGLNQLQCQLDGVGAIDFSLTLAGVLAITGADLILV